MNCHTRSGRQVLQAVAAEIDEHDPVAEPVGDQPGRDIRHSTWPPCRTPGAGRSG